MCETWQVCWASRRGELLCTLVWVYVLWFSHIVFSNVMVGLLFWLFCSFSHYVNVLPSMLMFNLSRIQAMKILCMLIKLFDVFDFYFRWRWYLILSWIQWWIFFISLSHWCEIVLIVVYSHLGCGHLYWKFFMFSFWK